ncbi:MULTISPECIES: class I SAM-dependent methyltransferase [Geobacillus]|uniref:class I SAM-dependent methyltransferase n=1 Tax=Geobacillus TaxID=129337 RepID=UPI000698A748|nr:MULTISPECIES: methyltransferase domain-containing protein [Geobacillus]TWG25020.1 Methylase involved in ubiquinone/menaquinone biosynthesis [Geobacillus sp. C56-T2]
MQQNASSARFNKISERFLNSEVHKMSPTIQRVLEMSRSWKIDSVCDVACGAGHFGISFRDSASSITVVDPAENMLETAKRLAADKGVDNFQTVQAYAEEIPLEAQSFDLVVSRLAPHHFVDIQKAVCEMARIVKPNGYVVVIDLSGYEDQEIDEFNHQLEILHDPTHVRSYRAWEWKNFFTNAGLNVVELHDWQMERPQGVSVKKWCEIASSGSEAEEKIRQLLRDAPPHYLEVMRIEERDNEYYMPIKTVLIVGQKRGE